MGLFLFRYSKAFKILEIFFLLGYGYCSFSENFSVVSIRSQEGQHNQVFRDFILHGECLWTFSVNKKDGKIIALATRTFCLLSSVFRVGLPSRLLNKSTALQSSY